MAKDKSNIEYNLEDFQRYSDGKMSFLEQHALEKRLMEDPFLAEAFEGFTALHGNQVTYKNVQSELDEKLQRRIEPKKAKTFPLWLYTAAASLVAGFGAIWLVFLNDRQSTELETTISRPPFQAGQKQQQKQIPKVAATPKTSIPDQEIDFNTQKSNNLAKNEEVEINSVPALSDGQEIANLEKQESALIVEQDVIPATTGAAPSAFRAQSADAFRAIQMPGNEQRLVTGQLATATGEAMPGVTILAPKNNGVVTDSSGKFAIHARVGDSLTLAMIGYKSKTIKVDNLNIGTIKLEEDLHALNEVVVVGYGRTDKKSLKTRPASRDSDKSEPVVGWKAYRAYLEKASDSSTVTGTTTVSFLIDENGAISDLRAKGKAELHAEAIRIVKEGPAWNPATGKTAGKRVEVKIKFRK